MARFWVLPLKIERVDFFKVFDYQPLAYGAALFVYVSYYLANLKSVSFTSPSSLHKMFRAPISGLVQVYIDLGNVKVGGFLREAAACMNEKLFAKKASD